MLNDIYLADQVSDFHLGARAQAVAHPTGVETSGTRAADMDTDKLFAPDEPSVFESSMQQVLDELWSLSVRHVQTQSQLNAFQAQSRSLFAFFLAPTVVHSKPAAADY